MYGCVCVYAIADLILQLHEEKECVCVCVGLLNCIHMHVISAIQSNCQRDLVAIAVCKECGKLFRKVS